MNCVSIGFSEQTFKPATALSQKPDSMSPESPNQLIYFFNLPQILCAAIWPAILAGN